MIYIYYNNNKIINYNKIFKKSKILNFKNLHSNNIKRINHLYNKACQFNSLIIQTYKIILYNLCKME